MASSVTVVSVKVSLHQSTDHLSKKKLFKMFKLVVLSVLIAIAAAKPSGIAINAPLVYSSPILKTAIIQEPSHLSIQERTIEKVGDLVQSVPTAVSHQSSTVVHNRADVVTPVVAPAYRTSTIPLIRSYAAPVLSQQPLLQYGLPYSYDYLKTPLYKSLVPSLPVTYGAAIL